MLHAEFFLVGLVSLRFLNGGLDALWFCLDF